MSKEPLGLQSIEPVPQRPGEPGGPGGPGGPGWPGWLTSLALAAMIGITLGNGLGMPILWLTLSFMLLSVAGVCICKRRPQRVCQFLILAAAASGFASWYQVHHQYLRANDVRQYALESSQLAQLTGTIVSPLHFNTPRRGALGQFSYQSPATLFVLATQSITRQGISYPAWGKVLVKVQQIDPSLSIGDRLQCTGWFRQTQGPANPGEYDYQKMLAQQDLFTRLTLGGSGNIKRLEPLGGWNGIRRFRAWCASRAAHALAIGMKPNSRELGLLQIMLLGQRGGNLGHLDEAFRAVGLTHLLAISGAHLGILLFLTFLVAKALTQYPQRAIWAVLIVLMFYLIVVPTRVPITRAGVMAAAFCFCSLTGLTLGRINILGLAALLVLIWRPADLFTSGFQLSFGTVAGLIVFVPNVSRFFWPQPQIQLTQPVRHRIARRIADYFAVNGVAFSVTLPLVAYHYQMISPWSMVLTMLAIPIVTLMLGLGFLKILLGMFFPSIAMLLSGPTTWATGQLAALVELGTTWPLANIGLGAGPSIWWMLGLLMVIGALFTGQFAGRRQTLGVCLSICLLWLVIPLMPVFGLSNIITTAPNAPVAQLHAISVGNGSCYILRLRPNRRFKQDLVILFDCGSHQFMDMGKRTVVPVLENLNIRQIDYLMLSHADIDHYSGTLDVADAITIKQVLMPYHMLQDARKNPRKATARLLEGLSQRQIPIQIVAAGWKRKFGDHTLKLIWPPGPPPGSAPGSPPPRKFFLDSSRFGAKPNAEAQRSMGFDGGEELPGAGGASGGGFAVIRHNDSSLVLSVQTCGRRILLTGDIGQRAMTAMLARKMDLSADIIDLPHHGSIVPATSDWLKAVAPQMVIQSAGWSRLYHDRWPALLKSLNRPIQRWVTARRGMVTIRIAGNGKINTDCFLPEH